MGNLTIPMKIAKWLNVRLHAQYRYNKERFQEDMSERHYWQAGYTANINLPYNILVTHDFAYASPHKSLYSESEERPICNVIFRKTFPKQGLNLGLSFMDILNKAGGKRTDTFRDDFYQVSKGTYNSFGISVNEGYNLRWGKKSNVRRASAGNSSEANRVASE